MTTSTGWGNATTTRASSTIKGATRRKVVKQLASLDLHVGRVARVYGDDTTPVALEQRWNWNNGEANRYLKGFLAATEDLQPSHPRVTGVAVRALATVLKTNATWATQHGVAPLTRLQQVEIQRRLDHLKATRPTEPRRPVRRTPADELMATIAAGTAVTGLYVRRERGLVAKTSAVPRKAGRSQHIGDRLYDAINKSNFERCYLAPEDRQDEDSNRADERWIHDGIRLALDLAELIRDDSDVRCGKGEIFTATLQLIDHLAASIGYSITEIPADELSQERFASALRAAQSVRASKWTAA